MKKIGFLSFGHWTPSPQSGTRTAADTLLQSIDLAVAAEELGADGAYFRVHHFARQLKIRCIWRKMLARQISSPAGDYSLVSAGVPRSR